MSLSHWQRKHNSVSRDLSTDILIVGGGLAGLSTAYWATELNPKVKVTLLERGTCGSGASGKNAGFLTKGSAFFYQNLSQKWGADRALEIFQFAGASLNLLYQKILSTSPELKFQMSDSLTLVRDKSLIQPDNRFGFVWTEKEGLPCELQSTFAGGWLSTPEYKVNPQLLLDSFKTILQSRNVQILEQTSAFDFFDEGIKTELNQIKAQHIVLALNGYSSDFHPAFQKIISPARAQMLAVELEGGLQAEALYYDPLERVYWRKVQEKTLVIGGKRLLDEAGERGTFEKSSPLIQKALEDYLTEVLGIKYRVINRWSGIMGFTEHELPVISRVEAKVPTYVIAGFSGHGMGLGFHSGKEMAELVLNLKQESFFHSFKEVQIKI